MPENAKYANVKMPAAFLTPHEFTAKDGRTFEKAYVHFPEGTKVNGIDLGHYSCDVFLNERMKQQMLSGEQVTIGFKADEPVQVWTGKAGDAQNPYKKYEVKPWDLVKGLKPQRGFQAEKAAEREAAQGAGHDPQGRVRADARVLRQAGRGQHARGACQHPLGSKEGGIR